MIPFDSRNNSINGITGMSEEHFRELVLIIVKEVIKVLVEQGMISFNKIDKVNSEQVNPEKVANTNKDFGVNTNAWYPRPAATKQGKVVLSEEFNPRENFYSVEASGLSGTEKSIVVSKLVTEEIVLAAWKKRADEIIINRNTIITPLARDAAREKKVVFREES